MWETETEGYLPRTGCGPWAHITWPAVLVSNCIWPAQGWSALLGWNDDGFLQKGISPLCFHVLRANINTTADAKECFCFKLYAKCLDYANLKNCRQESLICGHLHIMKFDRFWKKFGHTCIRTCKSYVFFMRKELHGKASVLDVHL